VKTQSDIARDWLIRANRCDRAELDMWRKQYPHVAPGMREAAEAQVDQREPRRLPATCIG